MSNTDDLQVLKKSFWKTPRTQGGHTPVAVVSSTRFLPCQFNKSPESVVQMWHMKEELFKKSTTCTYYCQTNMKYLPVQQQIRTRRLQFSHCAQFWSTSLPACAYTCLGLKPSIFFVLVWAWIIFWMELFCAPARYINVQNHDLSQSILQ